ncbi:MAG: cytochrome c-type biogenesis protein CcmH [Proteobacteria bacterium]|nr:cytochrome c-type biogenesis protein CcmH [Pseudomonadota bacterium]
MSRAAIAILARLLLIALLWSPALPSFAQANQQADAAPLHFNTPAEEARFHDLTLQLRCVMCQNQSLADSHALIALQLRREVLDLMRQGRSDDEIKAFLVQRYGEFVLYKPRLEERTWLLWAGPIVILLFGAGLLTVSMRRRRSASYVSDIDEQEW